MIYNLSELDFFNYSTFELTKLCSYILEIIRGCLIAQGVVENITPALPGRKNNINRLKEGPGKLCRLITIVSSGLVFPEVIDK